MYLLQYAEADPDLALLSVNAIQKSLTDQNPQVRAMALRTMSGMRVPVISQIVSLAIKRGIADMSPIVRKAAALAIPKCYRLDPNTLPQLLDYLSTLLKDKQYFVISPAVMVFSELCPDRIDLLHKHYRSLVRKLVDMDEWGQLATLKLMLNYARKCFPRPTVSRSRKSIKKGFYDDEAPVITEIEDDVQTLDLDLELLLKSCKVLLQSRNPAVIVSATTCFLYLGTPANLQSAIGPLISLLRGPPAIQQTVLHCVISIALDHPSLFVPYATHFFNRHSDSEEEWKLKLELLTLIFPHSAQHLRSVILSELENAAHDTGSAELVREAVRAIGRCAQIDASTSSRCFHILLNQITSFDNVLVSEVLTVIRHLIQQDPTAHQKTIVRLARHLDSTSSPQARATIIWLVAEYAINDQDAGIASDVLRILTKGFADESELAKQQILLLAAKVYLNHLQPKSSLKQSNGDAVGIYAEELPNEPLPTVKDEPVAVLWRYILLLTRYDTSYDLRDRARLFKALLENPIDSTHQFAALVLLAPKPVPITPSPGQARKGLRIDSSSLILTTATGAGLLPGYVELPDWVKPGEEPDASLRDTTDLPATGADPTEGSKISASARLGDAIKEKGLEELVAGNGGKGPSAKGQQSLDDWLEESEDGSEDAEEEEGGEEEQEAEAEDGESEGEYEEVTDDEETDGDTESQRLVA